MSARPAAWRKMRLRSSVADVGVGTAAPAGLAGSTTAAEGTAEAPLDDGDDDNKQVAAAADVEEEDRELAPRPAVTAFTYGDDHPITGSPRK